MKSNRFDYRLRALQEATALAKEAVGDPTLPSSLDQGLFKKALPTLRADAILRFAEFLIEDIVLDDVEEFVSEKKDLQFGEKQLHLEFSSGDLPKGVISIVTGDIKRAEDDDEESRQQQQEQRPDVNDRTVPDDPNLQVLDCCGLTKGNHHPDGLAANCSGLAGDEDGE